MTDSFLTAFLVALREGLEISVILLLIESYLKGLPFPYKGGTALLSGVLVSLLAGGLTGYSILDPDSGHRDLWTFWGAVTHATYFFGAPFLIGRRLPDGRRASLAVLFVTVLLLSFFEAGALASVLKGTGLAAGSMERSLISGMFGLITGLCGFAALSFLVLPRVNTAGLWSLSSLVLALGAFRLATGGLDEFHEQNLMISLQLGLGQWISGLVHDIQTILLIPPHSYLEMPFSGLMGFLAGDRVAMSVMLVLVFFPPVWILGRLVAAPDPEVGHIRVGAERRMKLAVFRRDIIWQGTPMMAAFLIVVFLVHAANLTLNPLFDPKPVPVAAEENGEVIRIPLADGSGDFGDRRIRKYLYYYGDKKIVFMAIQRPDGIIATALDECEICRPASWNTKAIGYAQRGENLVCKYCVTPISAHSVGEPGGCNPIPFESDYDENYLYVPLHNLIETWNAAQKIEKAGTHL